MTSIIQWNPVFPLIPLALSAIVILVILLILEWRRKQKFRWIRIACQLLAVASVLGLLLRPTFKSEAQRQPILIITEGYDKSQADSLLQSRPGIALYQTPEAADFVGAARVNDFRELKALAGDPVWVIGNGLPRYALSDLPYNFNYLPGRLREGVTEFNFTGKGTAERWNNIEGSYFSPSSGRTLRLLGPGGAEDSVAISNDGISNFSLSYFPKVAGRIVYTLEEKDSAGQTLNSHSLPVSIDEERKLDILLVNDHPSFEQRYLKNFLAAKGHKISIRNRVSKDRFHQEFANRAPQSLTSLTAAILDETDILIIDQSSFQSAPDSEKKTIKSALARGLGLLLLAGEAARGEQLIRFEPLHGIPDTVRFSIWNGEYFTLPAVPIKAAGDVTSLLASKDGRVLTGCLCTGVSRRGFQLLRETFQLGLEGETATYASIWSPLIERLSRTAIVEFDVTMRTAFPWYSNEPVEFDVISAGAIPSLRFDSMELPLREDVNVEGLWHGQVWAEGNKWHFATFNSINTVAFGLYDLPANEWNTLRIAGQVKANKNHTSIPGRRESKMTGSEGPLPLILLLLFVLSSGFLWLAPKI